MCVYCLSCVCLDEGDRDRAIAFCFDCCLSIDDGLRSIFNSSMLGLAERVQWIEFVDEVFRTFLLKNIKRIPAGGLQIDIAFISGCLETAIVNSEAFRLAIEDAKFVTIIPRCRAEMIDKTIAI